MRGDWIPAPQRGVAAALAAMQANDRAPADTATWVVRRAAGLALPFPATLRTEDGGSVALAGDVRAEDLPLGYHWLDPDTGAAPIRLIVCPGSCPLPDRTWGWAVQLYAARSRSSWGMGDLADLHRLAQWSGAQGAGMLLVNPLHAGTQASPYFPASRRWRSPLYLRIDDVRGATEVVPELQALATEGRRLNDSDRIDRSAVWERKRQALELIWRAQGKTEPGLDQWIAAQGGGLVGFATWSALVDELGPDWRTWPLPFRRPDNPSVLEWSAAHRDEVRFHSWLQWLVDVQLTRAATAGPALVTDLAIGADPGGADAWQWQDVLAEGVTVGAPPDEFSPDGQDWGLPPFDPWRLRSGGYEPFVQIVRAAMARGGGVRVDHVAGLFRLFWIPEGCGPVDGVYVRYPWQDLLGVLALEADRAGAFVVGEDLGTVEPEAREGLDAHDILSYRLLWFEEGPPDTWPVKALAAVTTHDLPTVSGVWTGADLRAREAMGLTVDPAAEAGLQDKLRRTVSTDETLPITGVVGRTHEALASAACLLVTATLDDALEVDERPNQPGTVEQWPNWSIPLPLMIEEIEGDDRVRAVAAAIGRGRGYRESTPT